MLYALVTTCEVNGINPEEYLADVLLRVQTHPNSRLDFGKVQVGRAWRTLSCFVLVLGHSRAMYACFFLGQKLECFLEGHVRAFEALGGVPRALLYDNRGKETTALVSPYAS